MQYMCFYPSWIRPSGELVSRFRTLQSLLQPRLWFSGQRVVLEILAEGESGLLRIILLEVKHIEAMFNPTTPSRRWSLIIGCVKVSICCYLSLSLFACPRKNLVETVRHHASHINTRSFCFAGHLKIDYLISAQPHDRPWAAFLDMLCTSRCSRIDSTGTPITDLVQKIRVLK